MAGRWTRWTPEEEAVAARVNSGELTLQEAAALLDRPEDAVQARADRIYKRHICEAAAQAVEEKDKRRRRRAPLRPWTLEDDARLRELIKSGASHAAAGAELGRSVGAIRARLPVLGISLRSAGGRSGRIPGGKAAPYASRPLRRPWTHPEDDILQESYGADAPIPRAVPWLARFLHRPEASIVMRARIIGLVDGERQALKPKPAQKAEAKRRRPQIGLDLNPGDGWSKAQDAALRKAWGSVPVWRICLDVGRSAEDVRARAAKLRLPPEPRPAPAPGAWWTAGEDEEIRKCYGSDGAEALAARLGRSVEAVEARARIVGRGIISRGFGVLQEDEETEKPSNES